MFNLRNRVAVITGATSALGAYLALLLAEHGADVALLSRNETELESLAAQMRERGHRTFALVCDVNDQRSVRNGADTTVREMGRVDILVNNADIPYNASSTYMSEETFNTLMRQYLLSAYYCCQEFGQHMVKNRYGRIINIASASGIQQREGRAAIGASRNYHGPQGDIVTLTRRLGEQLGEHGVTVNCICPRWLNARNNPGKFLRPGSKPLSSSLEVGEGYSPSPSKEELAPALLALATEGAHTNQSIVLIGKTF